MVLILLLYIIFVVWLVTARRDKGGLYVNKHNAMVSSNVNLQQVSGNISNQSNLQFCAKARYPTGEESATDISCTCSSGYHGENLLTVHVNCTLDLDPSQDIRTDSLIVQLSAGNEHWSSALSEPIVIPIGELGNILYLQIRSA